MSKIIQHSNNGKSWLLVEVPEGQIIFIVENSVVYFDKFKSMGIDLPPGEYSARKLAKDMGEEECREMCKSLTTFDEGIEITYADYGNPNYMPFWNAIASFNTLLLSRNLRPETTLIIEKTKSITYE